MRKASVLILLLVVSFQGKAQFVWPKGMGISMTAHGGSILKHTDKLTFEVPDVVVGIERQITFRTYGQQDWEAWRAYPVLGLSVHAFDLGSRELGRTYGFFPFLHVPLWHGKNFRGFFQVGSGIAWLTQRYDRIHNPKQNAIGSNINNVTAFRVHADWHVTPEWILTGGFSFTHYSNGQGRIPNFGVNIIGGMLGLQWVPSPLKDSDYRPARTDKKPERRWGVSILSGLAYKEYFATGGPRYLVYSGGLAGIYALSRINRLYLSLEYEYNKGIETFSKLAWQHESARERFWAASRVMVSIGEEFLYGRWAITLQAGTYLPTGGQLIPFPVYTRLGIRHYLPLWISGRGRFHAGVYLKSHVITAEHITATIGFNLE